MAEALDSGSETYGTTPPEVLSNKADSTGDVPAKEDVGWRRIVRNFTPS